LAPIGVSCGRPEKANRPPFRVFSGTAGGVWQKLNFLFLGRGGGGLRGSRFGGALLEFVHATGGVHEFLLAGVKWMAHVADTNDDGLLGGTRLDHVAAGATDFSVHIFRMNISFHKKGQLS
jgi:hypothetical protein